MQQEERQALGMVETLGYEPMVIASDTALKAAQVSLVQRYLVGGGLAMAAFKGDVGSVKAAMCAVEAHMAEIGAKVVTHVIARPDSAIWAMLTEKEPAQKTAAPNKPAKQPGDEKATQSSSPPPALKPVAAVPQTKPKAGLPAARAEAKLPVPRPADKGQEAKDAGKKPQKPAVKGSAESSSGSVKKAETKKKTASGKAKPNKKK